MVVASKPPQERISALLDAVINFGIEKKRPVGIFPLELSADELHPKLLGRIAGIGDSGGLSV